MINHDIVVVQGEQGATATQVIPLHDLLNPAATGGQDGGAGGHGEINGVVVGHASPDGERAGPGKIRQGIFALRGIGGGRWMGGDRFHCLGQKITGDGVEPFNIVQRLREGDRPGSTGTIGQRQFVLAGSTRVQRPQGDQRPFAPSPGAGHAHRRSGLGERGILLAGGQRRAKRVHQGEQIRGRQFGQAVVGGNKCAAEIGERGHQAGRCRSDNAQKKSQAQEKRPLGCQDHLRTYQPQTTPTARLCDRLNSPDSLPLGGEGKEAPRTPNYSESGSGGKPQALHGCMSDLGQAARLVAPTPTLPHRGRRGQLSFP